MQSSQFKKSNNYFSKLKSDRDVITKKVKTVLKSKSVNACDPKSVARKLVGESPGSKKYLGGGVYGDVYLYNAGNGHMMAVKKAKHALEDLAHEYSVMLLLNRKGLFAPAPYGIRKCDTDIMYYEFADNGTLSDYLKNILKLGVDPAEIDYVFKVRLKAVLTQLLYNLYKIQQLYPSFRHNDLHSRNVLVSEEGKIGGYSTYTVGKKKILKKNIGVIAYVHDFGFTDFDQLPNDQIRLSTSGSLDEYGLKVGSHPLYDVHFLFNDLYNTFENVPSFQETAKMIKSVFPMKYLKQKSTVVSKSRLRGNVVHKLPTIEQILNKKYFIKDVKSKTEEALSLINSIRTIPPQSKLERALTFLPAAKAVPKVVKKAAPAPVQKRVVQACAPKNIRMNKDNELKIKTKKCRLYKKSELVSMAQKKGIKTEGMTIQKICEALKKKYVNKV